METITSRQNAWITETAKLNDRKYRVRSGSFRFDGIKLTAEAVRASVPLTGVLLRASDAERVMERLRREGAADFAPEVRVAAVADRVFDSLSEEKAPEGILCVAKQMPERHDRWDGGAAASADERVVLLESVRDPSNLGAIIRSAAAFGVDRLVLSDDCADIYSAKTVRAAMGTLFSQRITRTERLTGYVGALRRAGRRVFAAALDDRAERLGDFPLRAGDCVAIGNEGHGLSDDMIAACSQSLFIPMTPRAESLNAAVAASVLMWEMRRGAPGDGQKI